MPTTVSPYALLRASKPKPASTVVTTYDLYSAAQQHQETEPSDSPGQGVEFTSTGERVRTRHSSPPGRTHYIADIKARHNLAVRKSTQGR